MRVWSLGTGSRGNAVLVEAEGTRVLIDAGFPMRELAARLASIDVPCESVEAALVTHEHLDHVRGACAASQRYSCVSANGCRRRRGKMSISTAKMSSIANARSGIFLQNKTKRSVRGSSITST